MNRVKIGVDRGRLRLRWTYEQKRYGMALGLSDSPANRLLGQQIAAQIERDMLLGEFDETLVQYRPKTLGEKATDIPVVTLFGRYRDFKAKDRQLSGGALAKYQGVLSHLRRCLAGANVSELVNATASDFKLALIDLFGK